ncbi:MAG: cobalamin-binding protein [bacterium]|nr:cobalamin-binding protein [bacterium]MCS7310060.1 cobalamin-binding protein [Armatimonadota bacterium]
MRIVSLLPSATEIVYALGLGDHLVGRSHECDYPPEVLCKPIVTRSLIPANLPSYEIDRLVSETLQTHATLYTLDIPLLQQLRPDLIITQALCSVCAVSYNAVQEAVERLQPRPKVLSLEPTTLREVLHTFEQVAEAAGCPAKGRALSERCQQELDSLRQHCAQYPPVRLSFLEWMDPLFSCGHWTPELIQIAGGIDGHGQEGAPSRRLSWQEVLDWQPEAIVLACCGFSVERTLQDLPCLQRLPGWQDLPAVRHGKVFIADGSAHFSRPGPRLVESAYWLAQQLHAVPTLPEVATL